MIQDNNIESLEVASRRIYPVSVKDLSPSTKRDAFKVGAAWQEQQYRSLIQSHAELLDKLKVAYDFMTEDVSDELLKKYDCDNVQWIFHSVRKTIEKASSIINQQK